MAISTRRIRSKLDAGHRAYGVVFQTPSPDMVEIAGHAGYDYAWLDAEHGCLSLADLRSMIRAANAVDIDTLVRIPNHEPSYIQRVLDLGASGIIAPHVRTAREGAALVAASKYAPAGIRGACPAVRSVGHLSLDWVRDYRRADDNVLVFGHIEDPEALDNIEDIAHNSGLDGLVFGPFDLAMALGLDGDVAHPRIREIHDRVVAACTAAGIEYFVPNADWEFGALESSGARIVTVMSDRGSVFDTFARGLSEHRAAEMSVSVSA